MFSCRSAFRFFVTSSFVFICTLLLNVVADAGYNRMNFLFEKTSVKALSCCWFVFDEKVMEDVDVNLFSYVDGIKDVHSLSVSVSDSGSDLRLLEPVLPLFFLLFCGPLGGALP